MKRTRNHTGVLPVVILAFTILCTGCASHKFDADEYRVAIGYAYDQSIASPQQQVLFQNDDKTVTYQVTYLPDTTAEDAAAKFGANAEKTTWEQAMWEYNRFCDERKYESAKPPAIFDSPDWDLTLWKFVADNSGNASTTETLFCDRADGCYSIAMTYPTKDTAAKIALYRMAESQSFQTDIDRLEKIRNGIDWDWEVNEKGELVITATNNGEEPAESVDCMINITTSSKPQEDGTVEQSGGYTLGGEELLPGETATFMLSAENMKDVTDYSVNPGVYFSSRMIDSEGKVYKLN
ncbi:MAG: hypothetical protein IKK51_08340 [Oscillospiraceae bacterium]|nr:hypothetical protein [Oscillospiraceae bacterium]